MKSKALLRPGLQGLNFVSMKKLLALAVLIVYGFTSSGMSLQFHYCCGKLSGISLSATGKKSCGHDHRLGKKSCCDYQQLDIRISADQKITGAQFLQYPCIRTEGETAGLFLSRLKIENAVFIPEDFSLPEPAPLYLLNAVFRI